MRTAVALAIALLALPVASQSTNLAPAGTASQSTTSFGGAPARASDGDTDGAYWNLSVSHTADLPNSWWEVDLGAVHPVHELRIHNRSDCCGGRLSNFRAALLDGSTVIYQQDFYTSGGAVPVGGAEVIQLPPGLSGQRVRVELLGLNNDGNGVLSLAEVEVLQYGALPVVNLAGLGTATQSSLGSGGLPELAIDGNSDGWWSNGSVSHTANLPGGWWELDLGAAYELSEVVLHNRSDCCWQRLSNFRVSVHDGAQELYGQNFFSTPQDYNPLPNGFVEAGAAFPVPLPPGTRGDRVRIELLGLTSMGDHVLSLAEVEVFRIAPTLTADVAQISSVAGGKQIFALDAGYGAAGLLYLVLGTLSGTSPGIPIETSLVLPLNVDPYWLHTLSSPNSPPLTGSFGVLDGYGRGQASLAIPPGVASLQGQQAHHAFVVLQPPPAQPLVTAVSNAFGASFVP